MMRAAGLGAFFAVVVVACSGGGGSSGGGGGATATDSSSFAKQYCDAIGGTCCPKNGKTYVPAQCVAFIGLASAQGGTYDPGVGSACIGAIQSAVQGPTFCTDFGASDPTLKTACANVYKSPDTGTKKPGDTCNTDTDCASTPDGDVSCETHFTSGAETKACQVEVRAKEGDTCNGNKIGDETLSSGDDSAPTQAYCWSADGLYCDGTTQKCKKRGNVGDACADLSSQSCVETARCDFASQKCLALTPIGGDCTGTGDQSCITTAYCDTTSKKCTAALAAGAACTQNDQCGQNASCTNQKCAGSDLTTAFLCGN